MRLGNLGLSIVSLGIALILGEIFLRVFYPTPDYGYRYSSPQTRFFQYNELLGWTGKPSAEGQFAMSDFVSQVKHDIRGYRNDHPHFVNGKENSLVIGDSYGWGWGVSNSELFSTILSEPGGENNIYNLSAPGYSTDQQFIRAQTVPGQSSRRTVFQRDVAVFHERFCWKRNWRNGWLRKTLF